jgi:Spy/CpxP family protein refolding chaperone
MKRLTKILLIGVTASSLIVGASAFANRGSGNHGARMMRHVTERLELDTIQVEALDTLRMEVEETRQMMRGGDGDIRTQISSLISAETLDQGAALGMINERAAAFQANAPELVAAAAVFFDGLNADQKADVQQMLDRLKGRHGRGGHNHDDSGDSD